MSDWVDHAIWWHVYPLGFVGAPIRDVESRDVVHRLPHLQSWLGHAVELGCSGVLLGPVFASTSHGYDTTDYLTIDPRLGDEGDMDAFLAAAKDAGLRVLFDGVFNHVGREHPAFQRVLEQGPDASEADWFRLTWPEGGWSPGVEPEYETFEGHGGLVALDHTSPAVEQLVVDVMTHWLRRGIDGWRLDAAYAVDPAFWARVLPRVREEFPGVWFLGEVIHGDYADIAQRGTLDSVTQYELWKAIWSSLRDRNFHELAWSLTRHAEFSESLTLQTFVGNHDTSRIVTQIGDEGLAVVAATLLFTLPGIPSVYYGDEYAYVGEKTDGWGGDDDVRPRFPESPGDIAFGGWMEEQYRSLIGLRRRHPWLVRASIEQGEVTNETFTYTVRDPGGDDALTVELATTPASATVTNAAGEVLYTSPAETV
ncbi:MAG: alpha-amylase family protein [Mobilicoccus sp.]|nr:alpha-amylase family protein [Mobilicoccus sp.]